ncbi:MAG: hypothetical protein ACK4E7_08070 [Permianibacter sp.]
MTTPPENSNNFEGIFSIKKDMSRETWDMLIKAASPPSQPIASPLVILLLIIFSIISAYVFFFAFPTGIPRKSGALFLLIVGIVVILSWEWSAKKRTPAYEEALKEYNKRMICTKCSKVIH